MAELGFLGLKYPEQYGGQGGDYVHDAVLAEELTGAGSGGLSAGIGAHIGIATPPIWKFGTEDQKQRFLVPAIRGERIAALGITEPGAGSDVAGIRTFAAQGRRRLRGQRLEDVHHQRRARGLRRHRREDDRGRRPPGAVVPAAREGDGGLLRLEEAREARLARLGHGRARLRRRVRPRREPARRGEQGLLPDHGQLPVGAAGDGAGRRRVDGADARAHASTYASERTAFGRPIGKLQAIRHKVAEMARQARGRRARSPTTRCACSPTARTRSARSPRRSCSASARPTRWPTTRSRSTAAPAT